MNGKTLRSLIYPRLLSHRNFSHLLQYSPQRFQNSSILIFGDGEFGFTRSLLNACPPKSLTTTTFMSKSTLISQYPTLLNNLKVIENHGTKVQFEIDSTNYKSDTKFDTIIWNFPHYHGKQNIRKNRELIFQFLKNSQLLLTSLAESPDVIPSIFLTLCRDQSGLDAISKTDWLSSWKLSQLVSETGYLLVEKGPLDLSLFPGYTPLGHRGVGGNFLIEGSQYFRLVPCDVSSVYSKALGQRFNTPSLEALQPAVYSFDLNLLTPPDPSPLRPLPLSPLSFLSVYDSSSLASLETRLARTLTDLLKEACLYKLESFLPSLHTNPTESIPDSSHPHTPSSSNPSPSPSPSLFSTDRFEVRMSTDPSPSDSLPLVSDLSGLLFSLRIVDFFPLPLPASSCPTAPFLSSSISMGIQATFSSTRDTPFPVSQSLVHALARFVERELPPRLEGCSTRSDRYSSFRSQPLPWFVAKQLEPDLQSPKEKAQERELRQGLALLKHKYSHLLLNGQGLHLAPMQGVEAELGELEWMELRGEWAQLLAKRVQGRSAQVLEKQGADPEELNRRAREEERRKKNPVSFKKKKQQSS